MRGRCFKGGLRGACVLITLLYSAHSAALVAEVVGEAFDLSGSELLYSETHCINPEDSTREVLYRNAEQQLIAYKVLNYETGATTPSFEQHNLYSKDSLSVELQRDEVVVTIRDDATGAMPSSVAMTADTEPPLVIDAGFDAFVLEHWDALLAGQSKRFQFPIASRSTLVELVIKSTQCAYATQTDQCFRLDVDNWLISLVADSIELGYDTSLRRLTRFRGVSNIGDGSGSGLEVDIHYRYDDLAALRCDK